LQLVLINVVNDKVNDAFLSLGVLFFWTEESMKTFHSAILALAIGAACVTSAQARDSFSLGINIGGYGYPPPVFYAPPITYYNPPVVYYSAAPGYYGQPVVSYQYYNDGNRRWRHEDREHHGWGHERREHGGWGHGRGHHDDDDDD
jgi:hypothetical protein